MVGDAERVAFVRRAKLGLVLVVAASAGLVAVQGDASLAGVAVSAAAGLAVGVVLVRLVFPGSGWAPGRER